MAWTRDERATRNMAACLSAELAIISNGGATITAQRTVRPRAAATA